jgi:hypothetical protein
MWGLGWQHIAKLRLCSKTTARQRKINGARGAIRTQGYTKPEILPMLCAEIEEKPQQLFKKCSRVVI